MKRLNRYSLESTKPTAVIAITTPVASIGHSGTPPMKATPSTIEHITIAEPRSPWTRQAPAANAASRIIGRRLRRTSLSTSSRRISRSAAKMTTASLRNSDGCTENGPTMIQALAPLTVTPAPGIIGSTISAEHSASSGTDSRRTNARLIRWASHSPTRPMTAHTTWRLKTWYGLRPRDASVAAEADSTITSPSMTNSETTTART